MSDGLFYLIIITASLIAVGVSSANMEKSIMRKQAIEHNAAFYDPYTAAFTRRENNE